MDKQEIFAFMRQNPLFHLATVDGDRPRVRRMVLYRADEESGILFHTRKTKELHRQLMQNPKVELCFDSFKGDVEVRVSGKVEPVEDTELKKAIEPESYDDVAIYRVKEAMATVWTLETDLAPKTYVVLE